MLERKLVGDCNVYQTEMILKGLWCKYLSSADEALENDALIQQALRSRSWTHSDL